MKEDSSVTRKRGRSGKWRRGIVAMQENESMDQILRDRSKEEVRMRLRECSFVDDDSNGLIK